MPVWTDRVYHQAMLAIKLWVLHTKYLICVVSHCAHGLYSAIELCVLQTKYLHVSSTIPATIQPSSTPSTFSHILQGTVLMACQLIFLVLSACICHPLRVVIFG
ncbi:hypothetical protein EDD17DRAFT_1503588 [Pisolithus thermaeus]|nr:hypothetical protein EDD17DRAFT_1503588 [Pisolithus thermaeus]